MILDGFRTAEVIRKKIFEEVSNIDQTITLAIILVGQSPSSLIYIQNKQKACEEVGMKSIVYNFDENISQKEIISKIEECNNNKEINGILVQMPLPNHLEAEVILNAISHYKDVDGLGLENQGKLMKGQDCIVPATALGVITLLKNNSVDIAGKNVVVVGRSVLVGRPLALLFLKENATVTIAHSKTTNLKDVTKRADILVVAIGKPKFVTEDMVKRDAVVVDVGINRVTGKIVGDVDFDKVKEVANMISPVPKGVGPMTIACLLENVLDCYKLQKKEAN